MGDVLRVGPGAVASEKELRLPLSTATINKLCGSWTEAIHAAGHGDLSRIVHQHARPRGPDSSYSEASMCRALRQASQDLGLSDAGRGPSADEALAMPVWLTAHEYERWRTEQIAAGEAEGQILFPPSRTTMAERFGGWPKALRAAGLIGDEELGLAREHGRRGLSQRELLAALVRSFRDRARQEAGPDGTDRRRTLTRGQYERWRQQQMRDSDHGPQRPPSGRLISEHFDGWEAALDRASQLERQLRSSSLPDESEDKDDCPEA